MIRALVWRYKSGGWVYDLVKDSPKGLNVDAVWSNPDAHIEAMGEPFFPDWREAFDAACADLRKRAES